MTRKKPTLCSAASTCAATAARAAWSPPNHGARSITGTESVTGTEEGMSGSDVLAARGGTGGVSGVGTTLPSYVGAAASLRTRMAGG